MGRVSGIEAVKEVQAGVKKIVQPYIYKDEDGEYIPRELASELLSVLAETFINTLCSIEKTDFGTEVIKVERINRNSSRVFFKLVIR